MHADTTNAAPAPAPTTPRIGLTGRCLEQPMSLALAIAEYEASRALTARSLVSPADPVVATPRGPLPAPPTDALDGDAPAPRRSAPPPPACLNSDDPGCRFTQPVSSPVQVHLDHVDHGGAPATGLVPAVPRAPARNAARPPPASGRPLDAHAREPWRPPAR